MKAIFEYLEEEEGHDIGKLWEEIKDIIIKTLITSQPMLNHLYKSCQPDDLENQMCFHILGFDIILDDNLKPWLLEVNQSPSLEIDTPLDYEIKRNLITDTLKLINLNAQRKNKYVNKMRSEMQKRILTGKI